MKNNNRSFAFVEIDIGFSMRSQLRCSEKDKNNIAEISELRGYGKVFRINIKYQITRTCMSNSRI